MAVKIISTRDYSTNGVKFLISGPAGIGKTVICGTGIDPIIISAEAGLLSLADVDIPAIEITKAEDTVDILEWARNSNEAKQFNTFCLDSISEIGEVVLSENKKLFKDPRQAYGETNDSVADLIRNFRDLKGKNVYFSAKQSRLEENDIVTYKASMPGKTLLAALPYFFDIVMVMRKGKLEDGTLYRYLQTSGDLQYEAKDRSGCLSPVEKPDLEYLFNKIASKKEVKEDKKEDEESSEEIE